MRNVAVVVFLVEHTLIVAMCSLCWTCRVRTVLYSSTLRSVSSIRQSSSRGSPFQRSWQRWGL